MTPFAWMVLENIVTLAATAAIVLGLYYMGAGGHSFWGLLLLLNITTFTQTERVAK